MPETRRIENYGVLKLLPPERGATNLIVLCDVIQLPFSEYSNLKSNPTRSHYGYVCFMSGEYVLDVKDIQFRRQILVDRDRHLVQLAWQEYCNSKTIAQELGAPAPDTPVEYSIWLCDELRFKLEPGVVINVFKSHIPPITCGSGGILEPDYSPEAPGLPPQPTSPPPKGTPDADKIPLSSPYEGVNDGGNTYVRGYNPDGSPSDPTKGETKIYVDINAYTNPQVNNETVQFPDLVETLPGYATAQGYSYVCKREGTTEYAGTFCNLWDVVKGGSVKKTIEVSLVSAPTFRAEYTP